MQAPGSYRGVIAEHRSMPGGIQWYYEHLPSLASTYPWGVTLAYMFSRLEAGQRRTLYAGLIKQHRASSPVAWQAIDEHYLKAVHFKRLFEAIFGQPLRMDAVEELEAAQPARNAVMHGQSVTDAAMRGAVIAVLSYSRLINEQTSSLAGFRAYGRLRGFHGRRKPISDRETQALLKRLSIMKA